MTLEAELRGCPPRTLSAARACAHRAVQLLTLAARANLEALPDDSHSSLVWERGKRRFASLPLKSPGGEYRVLLAMPSMRLGLANHAGIAGQLSLEGISPAQAVAWLDGQLGRVGLRAASAVALPYALPPDAAALAGFRAAPDAAPLATLAAWYDLADSLLGRVAERLSEVKPGAGPIRVWPHHFDIASFVRLRPGEDESAPGIGIGLSPGDESYDQPYLYATPWPRPEPEELRDPPAPGHWHREGFVSMVATAEELLSVPDAPQAALSFAVQATTMARQLLGA